MCTPSSPPSVLAYFLITMIKFMTPATQGSKGLCRSCRKAEGYGHSQEAERGGRRCSLAFFLYSFWNPGSQVAVAHTQGGLHSSVKPFYKHLTERPKGVCPWWFYMLTVKVNFIIPVSWLLIVLFFPTLNPLFCFHILFFFVFSKQGFSVFLGSLSWN